MKLKNYIMFNPEFSKSLKKVIKLDLDWNIAIELAKTIKVIENERTIIGELYNNLLQTYKVSISESDLIMEDANKKEEFMARVEDLMNKEFDIPLSSKLDLTGYKISVEDILNIQDIVEGV